MKVVIDNSLWLHLRFTVLFIILLVDIFITTTAAVIIVHIIFTVV